LPDNQSSLAQATSKLFLQMTFYKHAVTRPAAFLD
jgi:hypothetical protein